MKKLLIILAVLALAVVIGLVLAPKNQIPSGGPDKSNLIVVDKPTPGSLVKSPLTITGKARGYWYFEASFPARLLDGNGKEIAIKPAQAQGDWMTEEFV